MSKVTIINAGYRSTNYWVISAGPYGLLVDLGWPGTMGLLRSSLNRLDVPLQEIRYGLATHYHIDHAGLAQELKQAGVPLPVLVGQLPAISLMKRWTKPQDQYVDITQHDNTVISFAESWAVLERMGIAGEILPTPGHSDDSISLLLDDGAAFTGDLARPTFIGREDPAVVLTSWRLLQERGAIIGCIRDTVLAGKWRSPSPDYRVQPDLWSKAYDSCQKILKRGAMQATSSQKLSILQAIGNTPLVQLQKIVPPESVTVLVKLEYFNPTGSYKDRMALAMIEEAERRGDLRPGMTVVEYTGGSTDSSLAFVCAVKGYRFHAVSSNAFAPEKLRTMRVFGTVLGLIDSPSGQITPDLIPRMGQRAQELAQAPEVYFTNQFYNQDALIGYERIGQELLEQFPAGISVF